ncbi:MAG: class I SAM-dependent methyltransferase [Acidobacteriota bacterium]|nr:class I SAM-dependent methyltransferase [Acidobacteriota bacterium]
MSRSPSSPLSVPVAETYRDGSYAALTGGTWHVEDSVFKAGQVLRMLRRHPNLKLDSICDIGCGAGGVLAELDREIHFIARFQGYEVSPQAHALSQRFTSARCEYVLADPFADGLRFDLALALDVLEHVEDCFSFVRQCASKATWKIYHIPLDVSASTVLRGTNCWESVGHLHLFTRETALQTIRHAGQEVVDWFLTPVALQRPHRSATRITNVLRRILPSSLASRVLGGYSIMILAK